MKRHPAVWRLLVILPLLPAAAPGADSGTRVVVAVRTPGPVTIDGNLQEAAWQRAGASGFLQKEPDEGLPSTQKSEVWVAYDDEALYVAARLSDTSPDSIVTRIGRRDADLNADWFYLGIDSYLDRRTGFYFGVYCGGTMVDGTLYNDSWDDDSWDGVWDCATAVDEGGWTAEIRIPYSQLRFPALEEHVWGVNFGRNIERRKEESHFALVRKGESGWVSRFARLEGIRQIHPPRRLEVLPYVSSNAEFIQTEEGNPFRDGARFAGNAGADVQVGLGSNLTLRGTVNPDFGQVEVDPAVVNLTQFETYFDEKRPFFVEGSSFFDFSHGGANNNWGFNWGNPQFFYTRRLGRGPQESPSHEGYADIPASTTILGAAKLSGKVADGWSLGSLHALTAEEAATVDSAGVRFQDVVEPLTYYGVTRTLREFDGGRHAVGLIGTAAVRHLREDRLRDRFNSRAFALGADGWTTLDAENQWVLTAWGAGSLIQANAGRMAELQRSPLHYYQRPDAPHLGVDSNRTRLAGYAGRVALNRQEGNLYLNAALGAISPGFETNDMGFMFRADVVNGHLVVGYRWYKPDGVFRDKNVYLATARSYSFGGEKTGDGIFLFWNATLLSYWGFSGQLTHSPAVLDTRNTRGGPAMKTTNGYWASLSGWSDSRDPVVLDWGVNGGRSESGGYIFNVWPGIQWKPAPGVNLYFSPGFMRDVTIAHWVDRVEDVSATHTYGVRYVFGRLDQKEVAATIRTDITFTPRLSLQVYMQPLFSVGRYTEFKELKAPGTYTFSRYGEGSSTITPHPDGYEADPDGAGPLPSFTFRNPDFNFKSLRLNTVLRWEYLPGSTFYLVWTQNRQDEDHPGEFRFGRDMGTLLGSGPDNVFQVKVSYWLNP
ncbi:MAG: DUF5916 domain-containing protein [Bacteroidota bacterium]